MELRYLGYFIGVAEEENVSRAALKLHVSQSALSRPSGAIGSARSRKRAKATALQTLSRLPIVLKPREASGLRRVHLRFSQAAKFVCTSSHPAPTTIELRRNGF